MDFHCTACDKSFSCAPNPAEVPFEVAGFEGVFLSGFGGRVLNGRMVIESAACPGCGRAAPRTGTAGRQPMTDEQPLAPAPAEPVTLESALSHASRLLLSAELITDHSLMQRYESLADSWIAIARTVTERS